MTNHQETYEFKKKLDALSSAVLRAYFDSVMFLTIVPIANDKRKTSNFLFDYSYYSIRERAIIAAKSIIEPRGSNKLSIEEVIHDLQKNEGYRLFADRIYKEYQELFKSEEAKRLKDFRDSLCHNIENSSEAMIYCDDLMTVVDGVMKILNKIYLHIFNEANQDFYKIQFIVKTLADDYWGAICEQADKQPNRFNELTELQRMLFCSKK